MALTLDSPELITIFGQSTVHRAQGRFPEAIRVVEEQLGAMGADAQVPAYHAILWAAEEGGLSEKAREYASKLVARDPRHPAAKRVLGR